MGDSLKVYITQIAAIIVTLSDVHLIMTIVLVFLTIVYTAYKIMELEAKRRFYRKQNKIQEEHEKNQSSN